MTTSTLTTEECQRYARHFALPEIGLQGQIRLKTARILCVGAGGLGSPALMYLAAAGVGTLGIMDADVVECSNLQRQILFSTADLGSTKTEAAKARLLAFNPHVKVITHPGLLSEANAMAVISRYDMILDCTDCFSTRYLINDLCVHLKKPMIYASIFQFEGQCSVFWAPEGPCYRCLYPTPPPQNKTMNCQQAGVVGAMTGLLGSIQAMEAIKLILQQPQSLVGRLLWVDGLTMSFKNYALPKHPACLACHHQQSWQTLTRQPDVCSLPTDGLSISVQALHQLKQENADFLLLDVREPFEYDICHLGGTLIPLAELQNHLDQLDTNQLIIVHCKGEARSQHAAAMLMENGFRHVRVLRGGILAWIEAIEPTLPRY